MKTRFVRLNARVDLVRTLAPLRHGPYDPTIRLGRSGVLKATNTPFGPSTLRLRVTGDRIEATAWGPGASWDLDRVPQLIGVLDDPAAFRPVHRVVRESHRRLAGLRMCRSSSVLEVLIPTIIEQKVTSNEAHRSFARMTRTFGVSAPGPGSLICPVLPGFLADLPYHRLHRFGIERRRADLLRLVCARAERLEETILDPRCDVDATMQAFPGIGPWTSAHVRQVALGDADAVVVGDYHLPNIVTWVLAGKPRGTDREMLELLEPYRGQRARAVRLIAATGIRPPAWGPKKRLRRIEAI